MRRSFGRDFEFEVLGVYVAWEEIPPYVDFFGAIDLAVYKQPNNWDPLHPHTTLGNELLLSVRKSLMKEITPYCSQEIAEIIIANTGLYVALGTPADFWHQADAIICCDLLCISPFVTIDLKAGDDNEDEDYLRENHVVVTKAHFTELASNGERRLDNIAGVIAEQILVQLQRMAVLAETTQLV